MRNYRAETIAMYIRNYKTNILGLSISGLFVLFLIVVDVLDNIISFGFFITFSIIEGILMTLVTWHIIKIKTRNIEMAKVMLLSWKWE